jgi:hypothetical protein
VLVVLPTTRALVTTGPSKFVVVLLCPEEPFDEREGSFPDSEYPSPPILEEQVPNSLP